MIRSGNTLLLETGVNTYETFAVPGIPSNRAGGFIVGDYLYILTLPIPSGSTHNVNITKYEISTKTFISTITIATVTYVSTMQYAYLAIVLNSAEVLPFDPVHGLGKSKEQLELEGVFVEELPEPQHIHGKDSAMFWNPVVKACFFEYVAIPKTTEQLQAEKIQQLEANIASMEYALMMGGLI